MNDPDIAYAIEDATIKVPRTLWWTSDLHFGHANIIKYCARPFANVAEMDDYMVEQWNGVVKPDEMVMVIGDFSFRTEEQTRAILEELHGEKVLVKGNHDRRKTDTYWKRVGFLEVLPSYRVMLEQIGSVFVKHEPEPFGASWPVQFNGHVHDKWKVKHYKSTGQVYINVGVDQWAFAPVSTQELVAAVQAERERKWVPGIYVHTSQISLGDVK